MLHNYGSVLERRSLTLLNCNTALRITEFRVQYKLYLHYLKCKFSLYSISKNSLTRIALQIVTFNYSLPPFPPSQPLITDITDHLMSIATWSLLLQCYEQKSKEVQQ